MNFGSGVDMKTWNQMGDRFLQLKMLLVLCLLMNIQCKLLFWSFTLLLNILSTITQHPVLSILYLQSSIFFLFGRKISTQEKYTALS